MKKAPQKLLLKFEMPIIEQENTRAVQRGSPRRGVEKTIRFIYNITMKYKKKLVHFLSTAVTATLLPCIFITGLITACRKNQPENIPSPLIIAYLAGERGIIKPTDIPTHMLTHIHYAFAYIRNGKITTGHENDPKNLQILTNLKKKNPNLKIIISVGGWTESGPFSDMALTPKSRHTFIQSVIPFLKKYKLDGIDLDWEYPGLPGNNNPHRPEDKENFTHLLQELRQTLDKKRTENNKHYTLSIAAAAFREYLDNIEIQNILPYLDYIGLMTYDFFGQWENVTGHHANLYTSPTKPSAVSVDKTVTMFLDENVPPEKLIPGIPFYGRCWKDTGDKNNGLYQPGLGVMEDFSYKRLTESYIDKNGYRRYWDKSARAPYLRNPEGGYFITYEDEESTREKCRYIKEKKLGGAMFWEFHCDYKGKLLRTIYENLKK